jgi:hypothetical protein
MIKEPALILQTLPDAPASESDGFYTGAATIFGATGV